MTLHGHPIAELVALPDGREVEIRVGIVRDSYIADSDLNTVALELWIGGRVQASVNTVLDADQDGEARRLIAAVAEGLRSGTLEPTASSIEPLADGLR
jgi:hypothetical protein